MNPIFLTHLRQPLFYSCINICRKTLPRNERPRYLHSAVLIGGLMLVFGGNTHNDTSISLGAKCYSLDFLAYDTGRQCMIKF